MDGIRPNSNSLVNARIWTYSVPSLNLIYLFFRYFCQGFSLCFLRWKHISMMSPQILSYELNTTEFTFSSSSNSTSMNDNCLTIMLNLTCVETSSPSSIFNWKSFFMRNILLFVEGFSYIFEKTFHDPLRYFLRQNIVRNIFR